MHLLSSTVANQQAVAAYCRSGKMPVLSGVNQQNLKQYRRLVYNLVDDMLQSAYPLTYDFLGAKTWTALVKEFLKNHPCQSPQVWYMPKEFYLYLKEADHKILKKHPFLDDLLRFEWLEIELYMMEDIPADFKTEGEILEHEMVLNPEHEIFALSYPVHKKNTAEISPQDKGVYYVIAFRDLSGNVIFNELAPALIFIVNLLQAQPLGFDALVTILEKEFNKAFSAAEKQSIKGFIELAFQQNLILGFVINSAKTDEK